MQSHERAAHTDAIQRGPFQTADAVAVLAWLMNKGVLPKSRARDYYASPVAGIFRTVRFGTAEAHAKAEMMEFNYFVEQGAITRDSRMGRYAIDFAKFSRRRSPVSRGSSLLSRRREIVGGRRGGSRSMGRCRRS